MSPKTILATICLTSLIAMPSQTRGSSGSNETTIEFSMSQRILDDDSPERIEEKAALVLPRPNQVEWMRMERTFFLHFGPNTFRGVEWGDGRESPTLFNPSALNAGQWLDAVAMAGGKMLILVAKHHDGLCLWPSRYTTHSVARAPWRNGGGDLMKEVSKAAKERGIKLGVYLSPADLHQLRTNPTNPGGYYGNGSAKRLSTIPTSPAHFVEKPTVCREGAAPETVFSYQVDDYNRYFLNQLHELLTEYGPISAVWFDGANPDPSVPESYDYEAWYDMIRKLQPGAVISVKGPDVRWVGNEGGYGRTTEWSVLPLPEAPEKHTWPDRQEMDLGSRSRLKPGSHLWWYPAEVNTSILNGWFWSAEKRAKSPAELVDYFYRSVGRNGNMLLNLCPDTRGLIPESQLSSLAKMAQVINASFATDIATGASAHGDTAAATHRAALARDGNLDTWWEAAPGKHEGTFTLTLPQASTFDVISLQEAVAQRSQRIETFVIETWDGARWTAPATLEEQTTIGHKRLVRLAAPVSTDRLRVRITKARLEPTLAEVGVFKQVLPREPAIGERSKEGLVTLAHPHGLPIAYTLDGSEPTVASARYEAPIELPEGGTINAAVITKDGQMGLGASRTIVGAAPKGWKIKGRETSDTSEPGFASDNVIDANPGTYWRERASAVGTAHPSITVDMGAVRAIGGFAYLPRQDWVFIGIVDRYRFETSIDGVTWTTQVAAGAFGNIRNNPMLQEVFFAAPVSARFFRFTALHDVDDNGWVGAAELTVLPPKNGKP